MGLEVCLRQSAPCFRFSPFCLLGLSGVILGYDGLHMKYEFVGRSIRGHFQPPLPRITFLAADAQFWESWALLSWPMCHGWSNIQISSQVHNQAPIATNCMVRFWPIVSTHPRPRSQPCVSYQPRVGYFIVKNLMDAVRYSQESRQWMLCVAVNPHHWVWTGIPQAFSTFKYR